jgi:hypothetical protein
MPAAPKEKKIVNNTDVVSPDCSCKPGNLDELLAQLIAQHAHKLGQLFLPPLVLPPPTTLVAGGALPGAASIHATQDRPTFPRGVNGQLIDTVRLNGVYEMAPPYTCREAWLAAGAAQIAPDFRAAGYRIPEKMRFSIGFPSTGRHGATLGEWWSDTHSRDRTHEIFIRADQDDPVEVLAVLTHEMVHAVVGEAKHGPLFRKCALAVVLKGPMRHTTASPALAARLASIAEDLGPLPHAALGWSKRKKQTTRLLKAQCWCEYTVRVARTWVEQVGPPHCPLHGPMAVEGGAQ